MAQRKTQLIDPNSPIAPQELKDWRKGLLWTQELAADWLGYSVKTYQHWEQGERAIPMKRVFAVRRQMGLAKARKRRA